MRAVPIGTQGLVEEAPSGFEPSTSLSVANRSIPWDIYAVFYTYDSNAMCSEVFILSTDPVG